MNLDSPRHDPYSTLEQTKRKLENDGYTQSFSLSSDGNHLVDKNGQQFDANSVALNGIYRFVNKDNETDKKTLYALSTSSGANGILVDGYGKESSELINTFLLKVQDNN